MSIQEPSPLTVQQRAGHRLETLHCLDRIDIQLATWTRDVAALSARLVAQARGGALTNAQAIDLLAHLWSRLLEHLDLADVQVLEQGQRDVATFHARWLNLVLEHAPERLPEVLAAMQGRKIAALVLEELEDRKPAGVDVDLFERFRRLRTELRRMALDLRVIGTGSTAPRETSGDRSLGGLSLRPQLWRERVEQYKATRTEYLTCLRELASQPGFEALRPPQMNAAELRESLPDGQVLLVVVQPPTEGDGRPAPQALLLRRDGYDLIQLPGLRECVDEVRLLTDGTARLIRTQRSAESEVDASTASSAIHSPESLRDAFWVPMLPHLEGIQTLHVVTHGELHLLPLSTEGMNDIQVRHYPGLVFYWLQSRWDRRLCNPHSLAMQVYSPDHGDMPSPIPFVKAEARLVSSLWHPALSPLPFDQGGEVRVVHLAGHGEVGEGQDSRLLVGPQRTIGPRELLRSQLRPEVVYINACLLGHTSEDLDGDPLGFVSTFLLLGARAVIAPLVPISDVYAPILAALFHWELRQQQERSHVLDAGLALKLAKRGLDQGEWPGEIVRGVREAYIAPFGEMIAAVVAAREASSQQAGEFQADLLQSVRSWLPMCKLVELAKLCSGIVETLLADGPSAAARDGGAQLADLLIQHRARLSQHRGVRHLMMYVQAYGATAEQRRPGGLGGGPHRD